MRVIVLWPVFACWYVAACGADVQQTKGSGERCEATAECADGLYCKLGGLYPSCDDRSEAVCEARPETCEGVPSFPVCACDGEVYPSPCEARRNGTNPVGSGCTPPAGLATCGNTFCDPMTSLCATLGDAGQQCHALPSGCESVPDCACLGPDWTCDGFGSSPPMSCDEGESLLFVHCGF